MDEEIYKNGLIGELSDIKTASDEMITLKQKKCQHQFKKLDIDLHTPYRFTYSFPTTNQAIIKTVCIKCGKVKGLNLYYTDAIKKMDI